MDYNDINRMKEPDLRQAYRRLADAANKRLNRIREAKATDSPAYQQMKKAGITKFVTKDDDDIQTLRKKVSQARRFMNMKTSSVRGFTKTRRRMMVRLQEIRPDVPKLGKKTEHNLWAVYTRFMEEHPDMKKHEGSLQLRNFLMDYADTHRGKVITQKKFRELIDSKGESLYEMNEAANIEEDRHDGGVFSSRGEFR